MKTFIHAFLATSLLTAVPVFAGAGDSKDKSPVKPAPPGAKSDASGVKSEQRVREVNLLDAARDGLISVQAEGRGDGRMTVSITNRSQRQLRIVLPPGIIAQSATGQFGGMGGMGGMM